MSMNPRIIFKMVNKMDKPFVKLFRRDKFIYTM